MKTMRCLSLMILIAFMLTSAGLSEATIEVEPSVSEVELQAPADEIETPDDSPSGGVNALWLTDKKATAQMDVGEALQIALNSGEAATFQSKTPKLATVDADGLVTALAEGTAKIEARLSGGGKRTLTVKIVDPYKPTGVSIAQGKAIKVNIDETLKLDAVLSPATARTTLTWKSGKPKVATVDGEGVVTPVKEGKAKITVTTANKKKAAITVEVVDPYKPTGVSLVQGETITMKVDETLQLEAALSPETARTTLTWKSGSAKVATVDGEGLVTPVKEGKARITVTTANKKKATIAVEVVDPYKPTEVSIPQGEAVALNAGETLQLEAALFPEDARTTLTWRSGRPKVATVDSDGVVTALAAGKAKITVKTHNGKTAAIEITVIGSSSGTGRMNTATYNGVEFNVVKTALDPLAYETLVYDNICTHPGGIDEYSGYCLDFSYYYVSCMVDNITDVNISDGKHDNTSKRLRFSTEKYKDPDEMMARLYDLLNTNLPQILMVEAITHPGSRHFVAVVGYRASVTKREDLRPEDLLIIDSFDGKLESMDPEIELIDTRVIFQQSGRYRIEEVTYR